ncbi:MAG TPA: hypothetical protein VK674_01270 [Candidatus Limnocylindria bacterium]|nr:hypothetical protein [Candidatus Limnocylindria bacterium]
MTYSSSLAVGRQRYAVARSTQGSQAFGAKAWGKNQNTTSFRERGKAVGPISNTIILIVLACLVGLLYLTQVTKTNAYSYRINDLKDQQVSLKAEHDQLAINSARLQAQERVKNSAVARKLVSAAPAGVVQN